MAQTQEQVYLAALAGLLHDVGKFAQRAGAPGAHAHISAGLLEPKQLLYNLIPPAWMDDVGDAIAYHHGGDVHKPLTQAVRVADWLSASERSRATQERGRPETTPLMPIPALATLIPQSGSSVMNRDRWGYPLQATSTVCFPEQSVQVRGYDELWGVFTARIKALPQPIDTFTRLRGLLDALAGTTAYIPSATPWEADEHERTVPDVPLLQHAHLTAAIATCLSRLDTSLVEGLHHAGVQVRERTTPIARLVKADFSGIQSFIYRITEPATDRSFRHTAKRLRARSFHLAWLNEAVGEWLLRSLTLPPTQLLYAGGGVIEWLLPLDADFAQYLTALEKALYAEPVFGGALGIVWADVQLRPGDFADMKTARDTLEARLGIEKETKAKRLLGTAPFFEPQAISHVCQVCGLTPMDREGQTCLLCKHHEEIGSALPKTVAMAEVAALDLGTPVQTPGLAEPLPAIGEHLHLLSGDEFRRLKSATWPQDLFLRGVNAFPEDLLRSDVVPGRWNLANAAPILGGSVLDFEQIAALSRGTPLLGILKADADRMGLIFSRCLHPPTFSRTMALSATIHRFFSEYLNQLCYIVTADWKQAVDQALLEAFARRNVNFAWESLESIFYVLYAGGDDLFVVGPWDALADFTLRLQEEYRRYTCYNSEFGLSGGLVLIKPHIPIHQFAGMADEAERDAKTSGRNRLSFMGQALEWPLVETMIQQGKEWGSQINDEILPRGLFHDLRHLLQHDEDEIEGGAYTVRPMVTPTLYYTLVRRLRSHNQVQVQELARTLLNKYPEILVALEYAILFTRKE